MIDAMKLALEALEYHQEQTRPIHKTQETITTLRQAIEEAEQWDTSDMAHRSGGLSVEQAEKQEPVAWMYKNGIYMSDPSNSVSPEFVITPLYTAPPKREWVGLTDEEIDEIYKQNHNQYDEDTTGEYERELEAKLKERNNG
jgi:hypothetical protein